MAELLLFSCNAMQPKQQDKDEKPGFFLRRHLLAPLDANRPEIADLSVPPDGIVCPHIVRSSEVS
jgi:hypothetical protein